jgi:hypothetical protein
MNQTVSLPLWALYFQAFLGPIATLVAAGAAAWVTYKIQGGQLRTARDKLKLDLFERRFAFYEDVQSLLDHAVGLPRNEDYDLQFVQVKYRRLREAISCFPSQSAHFAMTSEMRAKCGSALEIWSAKFRNAQLIHRRGMKGGSSRLNRSRTYETCKNDCRRCLNRILHLAT